MKILYLALCCTIEFQSVLVHRIVHGVGFNEIECTEKFLWIALNAAEPKAAIITVAFRKAENFSPILRDFILSVMQVVHIVFICLECMVARVRCYIALMKVFMRWWIKHGLSAKDKVYTEEHFVFHLNEVLQVTTSFEILKIKYNFQAQFRANCL